MMVSERPCLKVKPVRALHYSQDSESTPGCDKEQDSATSSATVSENSSPCLQRRSGACSCLADSHLLHLQPCGSMKSASSDFPFSKPWFQQLTSEQIAATESLNTQLKQILKTLEQEEPCFSLRETLCHKPTVSMRKPRKSNLMNRRSVGF